MHVNSIIYIDAIVGQKVAAAGGGVMHKLQIAQMGPSCWWRWNTRKPLFSKHTHSGSHNIDPPSLFYMRHEIIKHGMMANRKIFSV